MEPGSDEWWISKGFKKIYLPEFDVYGWAKDIEVDTPISKINDVEELKVRLEVCIENEEFERAAELRDRIKELTAK